MQTIDFESVRSLELLANAVDGTATGTLFDCLDYTKVKGALGFKWGICGGLCSLLLELSACVMAHGHALPWQTTVGCRLLRANLLSPINDIPTLETRLDCVQELLEHPDMFTGCIEVVLVPTVVCSTAQKRGGQGSLGRQGGRGARITHGARVFTVHHMLHCVPPTPAPPPPFRVLRPCPGQ